MTKDAINSPLVGDDDDAHRSANAINKQNTVQVRDGNHYLQEFAENTMNELLGWYGLANNGRHRYDLPIGYHDRRRPVDDVDVDNGDAGGCSSMKRVNRDDELTVSSPRPIRSGSSTSDEISNAHTVKVDDDDVTMERRRCDWCKRSGPCPTCIDPSDCAGLATETGHQSRGLAFCDETCLSRYKMNIFCTETQQQLQLLQQKSTSATEVSGACSATCSSGSGADTSSNSESSTFLVTPELWMTSSTPRSETRIKKRRVETADNSCHSSEDSETTCSDTHPRPLKHEVMNGCSPVDAYGCSDAHSQSSEDLSKRDVIVATEAGTRPVSLGNDSGRRSTSSNVGGLLNPAQRSGSTTTSRTSVPDPLVWNAAVSSAHHHQSARNSQRRDGWRLKPPRSPQAGSDAKRLKVGPHLMTSSHSENVDAHRAPSASSLTSSSASMQRPMPLFAPWLIPQHHQQQQQQQQYLPTNGNDMFLMPPNCYANGVPMWTPASHLPQSSSSFGNAAATHDTLMRFAAAAAAATASASGGPPTNLNPPLGAPSAQMSSLLSFLTGSQGQAFPPPNTPTLNSSALLRAALDGLSGATGSTLPPNTLLVPYPVPMPLPIPIPIPIPVPFDSRLMTKGRLDVDAAAATAIAVEQFLRSSIPSGPATQPERETTESRPDSATVSDMHVTSDAVSEYDRRHPQRNSPEVGGTTRSPPTAHGSTFIHSQPLQTSALDFSTRTDTRTTRRDDVISPPRDNSTSNVASSRVKTEPMEPQRTSFTTDVDRTSALPPTLPYSARRSLILDAPPPSVSTKQREAKRENGVADKRVCGRFGLGEGTSGRSKFSCKGRTSNENGVGGGGGLPDGSAGLVVKTH